MAALTPSRNPGDTLTGLEDGVLNAIPSKYLVGLTQTIVRQRDPIETTLSSLTSTLLYSKIEQTDINEVWKTNITLSGVVSGTSFTQGIVNSSTFGIAGSLVSTISSSGQSATTGINVISSETTALGGGYTDNQTLTAPFDSTTVTYKEIGRRGFVASVARTWQAPTTTPTTQSQLVDVELSLESKDRIRQNVATYADGSPISHKKFNRFGGLDVTTDTFVAATTTPTNVTNVVQELIQEKEKEARLIELTIATGSAIATIEKIDPSIPGSRATIEYSQVLQSATHPDDTSTIVYEKLEHPDNPLMRIQRKTTFDIPPDLVEYRDDGFAVPAQNPAGSFYSDDVQGTTNLGLSSYSVKKPHKITHHFSTTITVAVPYQLIENEGTVFSYPFRGLMDALTYHRTVGGVTFSKDIAASVPSLSTYLGLVSGAAYHTVGGSNPIYRAKIYDNITIETLFQ